MTDNSDVFDCLNASAFLRSTFGNCFVADRLNKLRMFRFQRFQIHLVNLLLNCGCFGLFRVNKALRRIRKETRICLQAV